MYPPVTLIAQRTTNTSAGRLLNLNERLWCLFQAGLNGHLYKMPEIPETFPELSEMK